MFPDLSRGSGHHVERPRFGIEREAIPRLAGQSAEPEFAGESQRKAEHLVEMGLVAVPADADPNVVFGEEDLLDPGQTFRPLRDNLC